MRKRAGKGSEIRLMKTDSFIYFFLPSLSFLTYLISTPSPIHPSCFSFHICLANMWVWVREKKANMIHKMWWKGKQSTEFTFLDHSLIMMYTISTKTMAKTMTKTMTKTMAMFTLVMNLIRITFLSFVQRSIDEFSFSFCYIILSRFFSSHHGSWSNIRYKYMDIWIEHPDPLVKVNPVTSIGSIIRENGSIFTV